MSKEIDPYAAETTAVYRLFTVAGALLYVGIATHPGVRFEQHAAEKSWWPYVADRQITWYPKRAEALSEEARAIAEELPAFNKAGVGARPATTRPEEVARSVAKWVENFEGIRPGAETLATLFNVMVCVESLPHGAYHPWSPDEARQVYQAACDRAGAWAMRRHWRYVGRYNARVLAIEGHALNAA